MGPKRAACRERRQPLSARGELVTVAESRRPLPRQVDTTIHLDNLGWSLAWVGEHFGVDPTAVLNQPGDVASGPVTPTADLGPDALTVSRRTIKRRCLYRSSPR